MAFRYEIPLKRVTATVAAKAAGPIPYPGSLSVYSEPVCGIFAKTDPSQTIRRVDTNSLVEHTTQALEILEQSDRTIDSLDAYLPQLHTLASMWETSDMRHTDHPPRMAERIRHASHLFAVSFKKMYDYIERPQICEHAYDKLAATFEVDKNLILYVVSVGYHWANSLGVLLRIALVHSSICRETMSGKEHILVMGPPCR